MLKGSICECAYCGNWKRDMVFTGGWVCVKCVMNFKEIYQELIEGFRERPLDVEDHEINFLKSFNEINISRQRRKKNILFVLLNVMKI